MSILSPKQALSTQIGNYNFLYQTIIYIFTRLPGEAIHKYKLLSVFFDFVLAGAVYALVREISESKDKALYGAWIVLLLPTVWMNSAVWGQCDSIYAAFVIFALLYLYRRNFVISFIFIGAAFAFKLQTIFILPFFGYLYLSGIAKKEKGISLWDIFCILFVPVITAIPNVLAGRSITDVFSIYLEQTDTYHSMYLNYPSPWSLLRLQYETDSLWTIVFTFTILCVLMLWFHKKNAKAWGKHFLWCAFILSYTCVLFLPAMHERYGYLYEILSVALALCIGKGFSVAILLQMISMKTYMYYLWSTPLSIEFLAVVNLLVYGFVIYAFYRELEERPIELNLFERNKTLERVTKKQISSTDFISMTVLMLVFMIIAFMNFGSLKMPKTSAILGRDEGLQNEIQVYFEKTEQVKSVCIFQPVERNTNLSVFAAKDGKWELVADKVETRREYSWAVIDVNTKTHQLDVIINSPRAEISEIICIGNDGKRIKLKDGKGVIPELVDEQDCLSIRPSSRDQMIFDEIYHGRTAYEILNGLPIYETTHPQLGKILMSIGIAIFGMNPFGYRFVCLLFGIFSIPLIYMFTLKLTSKSAFALAAGILQVTEFMHYTLSRIATIDIIVAFFVMLMFYGTFCFIESEEKKYLVLAGIAFGLGVATKWTALYAAVGVALILGIWLLWKYKTGAYVIREWKEPARFIGCCIIWFMAFPLIIYVLSYIPYVRANPEKGLIEYAIDNSIMMFNYHANASEPHPYESRWYTWLFDWLPVVDYRDSSGENYRVVATFLNPLVCYLGLASLVHNVYLATKKDRTAIMLLVMYLSMLIPWMFITRTTFIYQYFICSKILILMIIYSIYCLSFKKEKKVLRLLLGISIVLFVLYLPVLSGVAVKKAYIDAVLKILPKWWF
ncbi:MAG: glycosyltransferase family 39 protein [Eubacteriales bacterium]|nr:glycosyltransferase family 39 protein [Eubacteriales bacterium]